LKFLGLCSLIHYMVNIQIRGNLIELILEELSSSEISELQSSTIPKINLLNDIKENTIINRRNIYQNILPIVDKSLELQISSFENDNYYDDGYTFFRSNLNDINYQNKNINIPLKTFNLEYFLIKLNYGYGAGFETEIIDLDYKNFETEKLNFNSTLIFDKHNEAVHSISLNYLNLEDLGRKKYEISESRLFLVKNNMDVKFLDLGNEIPTQVDILASKRYN